MPLRGRSLWVSTLSRCPPWQPPCPQPQVDPPVRWQAEPSGPGGACGWVRPCTPGHTWPRGPRASRDQGPRHDRRPLLAAPGSPGRLTGFGAGHLGCDAERLTSGAGSTAMLEASREAADGAVPRTFAQNPADNLVNYPGPMIFPVRWAGLRGICAGVRVVAVTDNSSAVRYGGQCWPQGTRARCADGAGAIRCRERTAIRRHWSAVLHGFEGTGDRGPHPRRKSLAPQPLLAAPGGMRLVPVVAAAAGWLRRSWSQAASQCRGEAAARAVPGAGWREGWHGQRCRGWRTW